MRARVFVAILGAAVPVLLAEGGAGARPGSSPGASPTNGQEVAPDLSDPGLDGVVRLYARIPRRGLRRLAKADADPPLLALRRRDGPDPAFTWTYDRGQRVLEIRTDLPLPMDQYLLDVRARLLGRPARRRGLSRDVSSSFTVGPDLYAPRLLSVRPDESRLDVPRLAPVVATFDESLDPGSVVLGESVFVENLSVQPPVPVAGQVLLDREGFDLVFRPDPRVGMPAGSIVGVRLLGAGNPASVRDLAGNGLEGNPADGNQVRFHFSTGLK